MKFKKLFWTGIFCLSLATVALADGETPIGPSLIQIIVNFITGN